MNKTVQSLVPFCSPPQRPPRSGNSAKSIWAINLFDLIRTQANIPSFNASGGGGQFVYS